MERLKNVINIMILFFVPLDKIQLVTLKALLPRFSLYDHDDDKILARYSIYHNFAADSSQFLQTA